MEANNSRSNAGATASLPTVRSTGSVTTQDDLGPLPPGWQMSKNDNERTFFIDHLNKRTTWVGNAEALSFIWLLLFFLQVDPRTGKPSPIPSAQNDSNQTAPLPVRKRKLS